MTDELEPFFHREGETLQPTARALGPWKHGTLHGRVVAGVLAAEIEKRHADPAYQPARLTVDLYRAPVQSAMHVETRVVRDGYRIKVIDAEFFAKGESAGRAVCQMLRRSENPGGDVWGGDVWDMPNPDTFPDADPAPDSMFGLWKLRWVEGGLEKMGQRRVWMREARDLIGGEPLTPFVRVATGLDYVSPLANASSTGDYSLVNSDLTMYLHRLPVGPWIGYESIAREATDGVALAHCNLYDSAGRIGWGSACALAPGRRASISVGR